MKTATIILDKDYTIGIVDPRLFGSFLEHLGRAIYGGIYEPGHPLADEEGFRTDVLELIKKIQVPVVRYPGGNFVSGFRWEDSIGPKPLRPHRLDLAWKTTETNEFGLHEFLHWCRKAGTSPMYSVNLGTRGIEDARNIIEYSNHPGGTYWSDLRIKNGEKEPFSIKLWCLGNEMDASWQTGQKTAYEYGKLARESAKAMKIIDPSIELVACGSTGPLIETFGDWELTMLDQCYDYVDYVSLHRYYENPSGDTADFLANSCDMDEFIQNVSCLCDSVKGKKHSKKTLNLSFDEWNVWYHTKNQDEKIQTQHRWEKSLPLLQDVYTFEDALMVGSMLITLLRHADRVKIACMAQLVNVIAPIMTENNGSAWAQTIYYPYAHVSQFGRGTVLRAIVNSPVYDSKNFCSVPYIDAVGTLDESGTVTIFCINKDLNEDFKLSLDLRAFPGLVMTDHILLSHPDKAAVNTKENPFNVIPCSVNNDTQENGQYQVLLPKLSWNVLRFSPERRD
ncbi:MAG: alpha-N-arabinofuranosidase [Eubacteriales bacterium]|nr:alpha-N-arabinofuranosidase [Eubacteriales bacterium]